MYGSHATTNHTFGAFPVNSSIDLNWLMRTAHNTVLPLWVSTHSGLKTFLIEQAEARAAAADTPRHREWAEDEIQMLRAAQARTLAEPFRDQLDRNHATSRDSGFPRPHQLHS